MFSILAVPLVASALIPAPFSILATVLLATTTSLPVAVIPSPFSMVSAVTLSITALFSASTLIPVPALATSEFLTTTSLPVTLIEAPLVLFTSTLSNVAVVSSASTITASPVILFTLMFSKTGFSPVISIPLVAFSMSTPLICILSPIPEIAVPLALTRVILVNTTSSPSISIIPL